MSRAFRLFPLLFLIGLLTACGFHLRGIQNLPPVLKKLYLQTNTPVNPFIQALKRTLVANGITLVSQAKSATATLDITKMQRKHQLTSMTGSNEAGQYSLYRTVEFTVTDSKGKVLLKQTTVKASRSYGSNASQVLSAASVQNRLSREMDTQLTYDMLNRLAKIKTHED